MQEPTIKVLITADCFVPTAAGHQLLNADTEVDLNKADAELVFMAGRARYVSGADVPPTLRAMGTRALALEAVRNAAAARRKLQAQRVTA